MGARLKEEKQENIIEMRDLEKGQLAVILDGSSLVVQKTKHGFITIGSADIYCGAGRCEVRILQPGELIEVT